MEPNQGRLPELASGSGSRSVDVLYIDDNEDDFILAQLACERSQAPFRLVPARSGNEAMEWLNKVLKDGGSLPRLILLDLHIQAWKDGLGLLETLTAQPSLSHIPVVVFTGAIDPVLLARARQLGARDVIEKSPQLQLPATLVEVLKKVGL